MARVLVTRHLPEAGLEPLVSAGHVLVRRTDDSPYTTDDLARMAPEVEAILCLITDRIDETVLRAGATGNLRVISNAGVGYDNVDAAAARRLGIAVCNTPGVLDQSTADLAFLLVLAATRLAWSRSGTCGQGDGKGGGSWTTWPSMSMVACSASSDMAV